MRRPRLLLLLSLIALGTTAVLAQPAAAVEPTREPIDETDTIVVEDICSFPVTITATVVGTETTFYDQSGAVTRIQLHIVEQDVFSANGVSLTGLPFTFNIQSSSRTARSLTSMPAASFRGSRFRTGPCFSAGRLDFAAHPESDFRIVPDVGRSGTWQRSVRRLHRNH